MKFRLANLLRVRALQEDVANAAAAQAAAVAATARTASDRHREQLSATTVPGRSGELAFAAAVAARSASSHLFSESITLIAQADATVELALAEAGAARRAAKALERLAARHEAAEAEADLRAEQAVLDEHGGRSGRGAPGGALRAGAIDLDGAAPDSADDCPDCRSALAAPVSSVTNQTDDRHRVPTAAPSPAPTQEPSR